MPLGGLLPYGNEAPAQPAQGGGGWEQIISALPQILTAFGAGSAIRQRDPRALAAIIGQFAQGREMQRRTQLQEEAQRLREERERRLAEMAGAREERLVATEEARGQREAASAERQGRLDLQTLQNKILDDSRATFGPGVEGAPLEEFITQQVGRTEGMQGADPAALRALLMSLATMESRPEPEVPLVTLQPGQAPPASVPKGAIVRNAPQPRQGPQPPADQMRVGVNPATGKPELFARDRQGNIKWLGISPPPSGNQNDPLAQILGEAGGGAPTGGPITVTAPNGKTYTFKSQAEADAFKRAAGIR